MITIVANGIMGTTYRQDVVVDGDGRANSNLQVLRDIRRQLSSQYGDDTPMTGWSLQSAPDGMWLSRIERAFDANYAPAFIMVSFLIPDGQKFRFEAIQIIEQCLIANHALYMQQNVILHDTNWNFLKLLEPELMGCIEKIAPSSSKYHGVTLQGSAYWSGDIRSMLENIWDVRFSSYSIVYCGKQILASGKEFARIDNVVIKPDAQASVNLGKSTAEPLRVVNESRLHPLDDGNELLKRHKEAIRLRNRHRIRHSEESEEISRQEMRRKKTKIRFIFAFSSIFVVFAAVFFGIMLFGNVNNIEDKASVPVEYSDKKSKEPIALKDSLSENNEKPEVVDVESQITKDDKQITRHEKDRAVPSRMDSSNSEKIIIFSADKCFKVLTWENVKNGGRYLFEKYEVKKIYGKRIQYIILLARKIGKERYQRIYNKVSHQTVHDGDDRLTLLEREIRSSFER